MSTEWKLAVLAAALFVAVLTVKLYGLLPWVPL